MCLICIKTEINLNCLKHADGRYMAFLSAIPKNVSIKYHATQHTFGSAEFKLG